ncbi:MAG: MBL fold metallo-hydrolase [Eubacteriales bacterium]|nr:MBL fold metallo-hydrolase [Eubacteriales bacterium]
MKSYITVYPLEENVWALDELSRTTMFVVKGSEKALLLDTGFGLSDLTPIVRSLCGDLPITVVNTHAHGDHNSGNNQFDSVCVGRFDEPASHALHMDGKAGLREFLCDSLDETFDAQAWNPGPAPHVEPLQEGDTLSLGNYVFTVLEVPGHSIGSIALYEPTQGWLFTGDMVLTWEVWGQLKDSAALRCYAQSLEKMAALAPRLRKVFPAHGASALPAGQGRHWLTPDILGIYARGTRRIVLGEDPGQPYDNPRFAGMGMRVSLFSCGGMAYDPRRI